MESICIETNLQKQKWLVMGKMVLESFSIKLNDLHTNYVLLLGDFNMTPEDFKLQDFCNIPDLDKI